MALRCASPAPTTAWPCWAQRAFQSVPPQILTTPKRQHNSGDVLLRRPSGTRQGKPQLPVSDFGAGVILAPGLSFSGDRGSEPPHPSQSWSTGLAASVLPSVTTGTSPSGLDTKFGERKRKFWSPRHPLIFLIKGQAHRSCHSESAFFWQHESPPGKSLSCAILLCR